MNFYIESEKLNMANMLQHFLTTIEMAAMKDDGVISKEEEKEIKRLRKAADAFIKELNK